MKPFQLIFREEELTQAAARFMQQIAPYKHLAFYGSMGAGKTTFIKALCQSIGTSDLVSSPTFAIVNEYTSAGQETIYHFDFYRIKEAEELLDIGFYEYCSPQHFCFIEWPEKAEHLLPDSFVKVTLKVLSDGTRELSCPV